MRNVVETGAAIRQPFMAAPAQTAKYPDLQSNVTTRANDCSSPRQRSCPSPAPIQEPEKRRVRFSSYGNRIYPTYSNKMYDRRWPLPRYTSRDKQRILAELDALRAELFQGLHPFGDSRKRMSSPRPARADQSPASGQCLELTDGAALKEPPADHENTTTTGLAHPDPRQSGNIAAAGTVIMTANNKDVVDIAPELVICGSKSLSPEGDSDKELCEKVEQLTLGSPAPPTRRRSSSERLRAMFAYMDVYITGMLGSGNVDRRRASVC